MKKVNLMRFYMIFVGISGCFSVLFGAWFAHAGQEMTEVIRFRLVNAQQYQIIHTLALLSVIALYQYHASKWLLASASCFFVGVLFFSGSLYIKTFLNFAAIGKITPLGGIFLALGWLLTIFVSNKLFNKK
ncbi:MAG: uncharacterized membrane protein YgdD (TMEM256/DUF423 family) [Alteromonadaceae bacterium]|jgi:uncharacterized membrane protein YgdD (TMEM256/DUF423 family)